MKKLLLAISFTFLSITSAQAQERSAGDIELAPYVTYMSSFFNGDNADSFKPKSDVSFGVKADYYFNDRWSLRSGVNYDNMGSGVDGASGTFDLTYINIPLNANWHFGSTRKWNLNFGVTPGFLTKAEADGNDIKDGTKSFQLGISYGIGYKLEISENFSILFDAQGLVGVTQINDDNSGDKLLNAGSGFGIGGVFKL